MTNSPTNIDRSKLKTFKIYLECWGGLFHRKIGEEIEVVKGSSLEAVYKSKSRSLDKINKTRECPILIKDIVEVI